MTPALYGSGLITGIYMMPDEIEAVIEQVKALPEEGLMVEWGSGGSTCRWLETLKPTQKLISIESDIQWYNVVKEAANREFDCDNFEFLYRPELLSAGRESGQLSEELPYWLDRYINPGDHAYDADLYFVDGIARAACIAGIAIKHKKPDPVILVHDFTGRASAYNWIVQYFRFEILTGTLARIYLT